MNHVLVELCDRAFGSALLLMRAALVVGDSRVVRGCVRALGVGVVLALLVALLVCAALGATWLCLGHAPGA